jgi:hypothetical protein
MTINPKDILARAIEAETHDWSPAQKAALLHRMARESTRLQVRNNYPTAGKLARAIEPSTVQTPALDLIDEALEWAFSTPDARLAISMPPQEGKTTRVGVWGVLRALVQDPDRRCVLASYSEMLARSTARTSRNLISEFGHGAKDALTGVSLPDRLGLSLSADKTAAGNWKLAGHDGGLYAVGVGGSLTGQPADCIVGSTVLQCEHGPITAAEAYANPPEYLLGYNERTGQPAWHRLEAARRINRRPVIEVTTRGGKSLTCTADHQIYTGGRYAPAGNLRPGQALLHIDTSTGVPELHRPIHREAGRGKENRDTGRPHALLQKVLLGKRVSAVSDPFLPLWRASTQFTPLNLLGRLPARKVPTATATRGLPGMREGIYSHLVPKSILLKNLRRPGTLKTHDGGGQLAPPASVLTDAPLPTDTATHSGPGRAPLRDMRDGHGPDRAPLRRGPGQQPGGKPDNAMPRLPHHAPQVSGDPVSMVAGAGHAPVYDFQVDGDHNFFANGLLVHNCLIIDDPLKGMTEADSRVERDKVITWWESIAQTRLAPGAPVIIIQTRWHEDDLVGHILKQDGANEWKVLNLPAVATPGIRDALNRPAGEALQSARGRTAEDFARIRKNVGERVWAALYLGSPTPARGGLFEQGWFDRYRAEEPPHDQLQRIVSVDPAETGKGDEAGIIGLTVTQDGRVWVTHDHSGNMQSDQWARAAVLLALRTGAGELLFEAFTTGPTYERVIEDAWRRVRREAEFLRNHDNDLVKATVAYAHSEYAPDDALKALKQLVEIDVPNQPDMPFVVRPWRAKGDKTARAAGTRQAASTGRLRLVGSFPELESQATQWQQGQSSPDRLDALVHGFERCAQIVGSPATIASPSQTAAGTTMNAGFWSARID